MSAINNPPLTLNLAPPANTKAIGVTGYSLTGSDATSMHDWAGTWNTSGTPTAIKLNITNTASNAASLLFDLQVGGVSQFQVRKDALVTLKGTEAQVVIGYTNEVNTLLQQGGLINASGSAVAWSSSSTAVSGANRDVYLYRDAANTLALRNGTAVQTQNWYGTYTSATDYHRGAVKAAKSTASAVSGASVTLSALIPDGAVVIGVTTKVTTGLGTGSGTTGYQVGDGVDADRWGDITGTASGTSSDNTNATSTTVGLFIAANDVVLTAKTGNFDGTGAIEVCVFYLIAQCD